LDHNFNQINISRRTT